MKAVLQEGRRHVLRFDKDEEVMGGLAEYAKKNEIKAAYFSGIGSCSHLELGYFNPTLKNYRKKPFYDNREIVSFSGNVTLVDGAPAVHAHGIFSDNDFLSVAGHVFNMTVLATCEIVLVKLEGPLQRQNNADFNLNLLV